MWRDTSRCTPFATRCRSGGSGGGWRRASTCCSWNRTPIPMTDELEQLLKNVRLRRMLSVYDEQLRAAEKADVSYSAVVAGLWRAEWHDRQESALEGRIRRANLPDRG